MCYVDERTDEKTEIEGGKLRGEWLVIPSNCIGASEVGSSPITIGNHLGV